MVTPLFKGATVPDERANNDLFEAVAAVPARGGIRPLADAARRASEIGSALATRN